MASTEASLVPVVTFKRLKGGVVDELGLLDQVEVVLDTVIGHFRCLAPVEKVIVVDHAATEIRLLVGQNEETIQKTRRAQFYR